MAHVWDEIVREHRALRGALERLEGFLASDRASFFMLMEVFLDFLRRVHVELEDRLVFPALARVCAQHGRTLARLEADHRLLETLGNTIITRGRGFGWDTLRERFEQFKTTLLEHNVAEESLYSRVLADCGSGAVEAALQGLNAEEAIGRFGLERYREFMEFAGYSLE